MFVPAKIYFEEAAADYELGRTLLERYRGQGVETVPIASHNSIVELQQRPNCEFPQLKRNLIIGVRKTHKYVPNQKVSDFLVPWTSSGCTAMCLYCYLVCNYNKCSYLRLFVNREEMLAKLIKTAARSDRDLTFEIGSNSDLVLENTLTGNLEWTIENFARDSTRGALTFPTKFGMVDPLLPLDHRGKVIARVSVNPESIIKSTESGTSGLQARIRAANRLADAGYRVGVIIAPVIMVDGWKALYAELITQLRDSFSPRLTAQTFFEVIFMTYSFVHRAINNDAFPDAVELYDKELMTGRGRGKYWYKEAMRTDGAEFLRGELAKSFPGTEILYIV